MANKVIFFFIDGIGLGLNHPKNPFTSAEMPYLNQILGGPMIAGRQVKRSDFLLKGIDACLETEGPPQSATGQTALFTGINAAQVLGYHLPAYPNQALTEILYQENILKRTKEKGLRATFANAYSPGYFNLVESGKLQHSATTLSVLGADLPFRMLSDLEKGQAVFWDITHRYSNAVKGTALPEIEPKTAGGNLARLAKENELVLYECFLPDLFGHRMDFPKALAFLEILDQFIQGVLDYKGPDVNLVISSDHGNMEDMEQGGHTYNPVPLLVAGPDALLFDKSKAITDIANCIMEVLEGT